MPIPPSAPSSASMATSTQSRGTGYTDGLEFAGFWMRLGAALIDAVRLILVTMPLLVWIYGWAITAMAGSSPDRRIS